MEYLDFKRLIDALTARPKEHETVLAALKEASISEEMKLDCYESHINWYN